MTAKKVLIGIIAVAVLTSAFLFVSDRIHAQDQDQSGIAGKLEQILSNQKIIMDQIASMRQELNIIKIRITQSQ